MSSKPTILFVHGAWHQPLQYKVFLSALEARGYPCVAPALPSVGVGAKTRDVSLDDDVAVVRAAAEPLFERGEEVVLLGHSYGAALCCLASEGRTIADRAAAGKKGGFKEVIWFGGVLATQRGGMLHPAGDVDWPEEYSPESAANSGTFVLNSKAKKMFYNDLPDDVAQEQFELCLPQAKKPFITPVHFIVDDVTIPKTSIILEEDYGMPTAGQIYWANTCKDIKSVRLNCGHSPFLSKTKELTDIIVNILEDKARL